jgi:ATP-dependent helicase/nuclease subunit B
MQARFLLGRAGTGKTYQCLREVRAALAEANDGPPLLLLVPEQATYQMDRALLGDVPGGASSRALVVSFRRLTFRLLGEVGGLETRLIGDLGRQMLVHALLRRQARELRLYKWPAIQPGLAAHLSRIIHELKQYCVTPNQLQEWLDTVAGTDSDSLLALKLHDLHRIYEKYVERSSGSVLDADDLPDLLVDAARRSSWLEGAHLWVDSFSDFTKQEYAILKTLASRLPRVTFALALDPHDLPADAGDATRLFARAENTYRALRQILPADATAEVIALPIGPSPPRFKDPALAHVEAVFAEPKAFNGTTTAVTLVEAGNRRAEVHACARALLHLVRERGYRYRDLAVIVRDMANYHDLIEAIFEDHDIPFFIDQRRPMIHHPLVEVIRCAVRAVSDGWRHEYVVPYLRTGLAPVTERTMDVLDNYVVEFGIAGDAWYNQTDWRYHRSAESGHDGKDDDWLNRQRWQAIHELVRFQDRILARTNTQGKVSVRQAAEAVYELLHELKAANTLERWRREAEESKRLDIAGEHIQVWDGVIGLLDELAAALDEEVFTLREFADILEAGLASLNLGLIPPAVDEVLVGSIERSRQPEIKAAFVLGLIEGRFPLVADDDPILGDGDRTHPSARLELGPTSEQRFDQERYLGYIAFTRASDYLWVSYPIADEVGRPLNSSAFIDRLRLCFPGLEPERVGSGHGPPTLAGVWSARDLAGGLAQHFRRSLAAEEMSGWLHLYNHALEAPDTRNVLARVLPARTYGNSARLTPESARALFGDTLQATVSRLESFALCPYQHFARFGLRLRPRREFRLAAFDLGNLCHAVLKYFFDQTRDKKWSSLPWAHAEKLVDEGLDQEAARLRHEIFMTTACNRYVREQARRDLKRFVRGLLEQARSTDFEPVQAELGFGEPGDTVAALEWDLGDGRRLTLHGRIDRVDAACDGAISYVRTIDYKTGARLLNLGRICHGLDLQLLAYLLAVSTPQAARVLGLQQAVAAGAFYSSLFRDIKSAQRLDDADDEHDAAYRLRGVFRSDVARALDNTEDLVGWSRVCQWHIKTDGTPGWHNISDALEPELFARLLDVVSEQLVRLGQEILEGQITIAPAESNGHGPCRFCDFRSLCRMESPYNSIREIPAMKKTEAIMVLQEGAGPPR